MAIPTLRFKQPDGKDYPAWEDIGLASIFSEISEKNRTDLPVLSIKQGFGTVLRDESGINIVYSKDNLKNYKAIQRDDFIIHLRSFEGGLECSRYDGISSPAYKILRCNSTILPSLYKYYFRSRNFISKKLAKAVVGIRDGKNIDMNIFWRIAIPVACLEEQQRIASFITDVDEQIENYQQSLDNLESQKKELLRQVFAQEMRFKKEDGSDFPDWTEDLFENICIVNPKSNPIEDEFYYIDLESVHHGRLLSERIEQKASAPSRAKRLLEQDDVLFQTVRPYLMGHYHFAMCKDKQVVASTGFAQLRMKHGCNKFLYHFLYSESFNAEVLKSCNEGHYPAINATSLRKIPICVPTSIEEQQKIADFFSDFDERIELERQRLQTMQDLKKGLLQQMFC